MGGGHTRFGEKVDKTAADLYTQPQAATHFYGMLCSEARGAANSCRFRSEGYFSTFYNPILSFHTISDR